MLERVICIQDILWSKVNLGQRKLVITIYIQKNKDTIETW